MYPELDALQKIEKQTPTPNVTQPTKEVSFDDHEPDV